MHTCYTHGTIATWKAWCMHRPQRSSWLPSMTPPCGLLVPRCPLVPPLQISLIQLWSQPVFPQHMPGALLGTGNVTSSPSPQGMVPATRSAALPKGRNGAMDVKSMLSPALSVAVVGSLSLSSPSSLSSLVFPLSHFLATQKSCPLPQPHTITWSSSEVRQGSLIL